jgi:hypothetical protein
MSQAAVAHPTLTFPFLGADKYFARASSLYRNSLSNLYKPSLLKNISSPLWTILLSHKNVPDMTAKTEFQLMDQKPATVAN